MNEIYISLPFVQFILSLFLASVVLFSDPRSMRNRLFVLFLGAMGLWGVTVFGMRDAFPDETLAYTWERFILAIVPFSGIVFYHFFVAYARIERRKSVLVTFYSLGVISAVLSLLGFAASGMVERFYGFAPQLGWAFPVVLLASYPPVILSIVDLTKARKSAESKSEASRLGLLRTGVIISIIGGTTDFLPSLGVAIYPMGVIGNLVFASMTTWAVAHHHFMDLRLVLRRGLAYTVMSAIIFGTYGFMYGVLWLIVRNMSAVAGVILTISAILIVGLFVQPLVRRVQDVVDRLFFREQHDRLHSLGNMNEQTREIVDMQALAGSVTETLRRTVQSDWIAIMAPGPSRSGFTITADTRAEASHGRLPANGMVASWMVKKHTALQVVDIDADPELQAMSQAERRDVDSCDAVLFVPMIVKGSLTGIIAVGSKLVGSGYSSGDLSFLTTAAEQVAIALENARLYAAATREARERTALAELGRVVNASLDLQIVFERCEARVRQLIVSDRFVISFVDDEGQKIVDAFSRGPGDSLWPEKHSHTIEGSPFEEVVRTANGIIIIESSRGGRFKDYLSPGNDHGPQVRSMMTVPISSGGTVIGTMSLMSQSADAYQGQDLELAMQVGAQISTAIANSQSHERALQLAQEREERAIVDAENRELQRVNEAKSQFLSTVSHELKTPLTSVLAFGDILKANKEGNLTDRQQQALQIMDRNGRRLNVLIDDLLDVSRIDSGNLKIDRREFDARMLLEELELSFAPIVTPKQQTLKFDVPDQPLYVFADRDRITQVVSNLLSNASKYSGEGTSIELRAREDGTRLYIEVEDHGIGISEADRKQLFTPFFRADNPDTRSVPGTGLGLVITAGIVESHGGQISVTSERSSGTTISFYVPLSIDSDEIDEKRVA
ncbi:MAG: GAF domain-containing protein [Chloroflexi bacterium]|nr:GAF domain-containing protein [Chloroflexota bacterium]